MELLTKIIITVLVILTGAKALHWTWTSHIDPIATIHKFLQQKPKIANVVVSRDPNKLYQWSEGGHPLKGTSREKHLTIKKIFFFYFGFNYRPSAALFNPPIRARYFSLFGSRSAYTDPHQSPIGIQGPGVP